MHLCCLLKIFCNSVCFLQTTISKAVNSLKVLAELPIIVVLMYQVKFVNHSQKANYGIHPLLTVAYTCNHYFSAQYFYVNKTGDAINECNNSKLKN